MPLSIRSISIRKQRFRLIQTGLDKFISTRPIFRARKFTCTPDRARKKTGAQNQTQCARLIKKNLETFIFVFCYLNRTCCFYFYLSFSIVLAIRPLQCIIISSFKVDFRMTFHNYKKPINANQCKYCLMSKIRCISKNNSHTSDESV